MNTDSDPERAGMARAVKTFGLDEDETLHLVATTGMGVSRDIGQVHRPGELAVVKTDQLLSASRTAEPVDESEQLDVQEFSVVGDTVTIESDGIPRQRSS